MRWKSIKYQSSGSGRSAELKKDMHRICILTYIAQLMVAKIPTLAKLPPFTLYIFLALCPTSCASSHRRPRVAHRLEVVWHWCSLKHLAQYLASFNVLRFSFSSMLAQCHRLCHHSAPWLVEISSLAAFCHTGTNTLLLPSTSVILPILIKYYGI